MRQKLSECWRRQVVLSMDLLDKPMKTNKKRHYLWFMQNFFFAFFFFFFFGVLGLHLWHIDGPRLGVKSELQLLAYTTATRDPSRVCSLHHSSLGNTGSLTHSVRPGMKPISSWILVGFVTRRTTTGTLEFFNILKVWKSLKLHI